MESTLYSRKHCLNWFLMASLAGSVNAGGFLACQRFVSHVTGFATLFGVEVAENHWDASVGFITIPIFFLAGSMLAAVLTETRIRRGKTPLYSVAMMIVAICLLLSAFGGRWDWFDRFGAPLSLKHDYCLLALLSAASGILNAVVSNLSGNVVRSTHLTGITTDLGIGIVRVLSARDDGSVDLKKERRFNSLRLGTIAFFSIGSLVGAILFIHYDYLGFLLPAGMAIYGVIAAELSWKYSWNRQTEKLDMRQTSRPTQPRQNEITTETPL